MRPDRMRAPLEDDRELMRWDDDRLALVGVEALINQPLLAARRTDQALHLLRTR